MHFEALEIFEWLNEPDNVRFEDDAMIIYAKPQTDFWQSIHHGFKKDDGHFFFCRQKEDFILTLKWRFENLQKFSQCGIMLRIDERNWFKASLMNETSETNTMATSLTINGHSDWSGFQINNSIEEIWFRLQRVEDDYILFYSLNGLEFKKIKMFYIPSIEEVKVGAYIASPNEEQFCAELSNISL